MIKVYEEAWTYVRYTYDVSNRMLWYSLLIITVIGAIASRIFVLGDGITDPIQLRDPSTFSREETNVIGFIFLVLFISGLIIHAYYVFQRVIIDRQMSIIKSVDQYFIDKAKPAIDLEKYLYLRRNPVKQGSGDLIAQTRLLLSVVVNSLTGTLCTFCLFQISWIRLNWIIMIFLGLGLLQFFLINVFGYRWLCNRIVPKESRTKNTIARARPAGLNK